MGWLMAAHIATLTIWSAGLLYLPVLYMVNRKEHNAETLRRLRVISRVAYTRIASPAAVLAILTGTALVYVADASGAWLAAKLAIVTLMGVFHAYCGHMLALLGHEGQHKAQRHTIAGWQLIVPLLLIPTVLWLVLAKPAFFANMEGGPW
ncbi:MAG: CopD family protein [Candidimonas sp.]|nr:CopD family protein [Candidimonas sp.]NYT43219.1 CopD family protein [Alcaligenaceae bacterium]